MRFLTYLPHDVHALDHMLQDKITTQIAGALAIRISQAEQQRALLSRLKILSQGAARLVWRVAHSHTLEHLG